MPPFYPSLIATFLFFYRVKRKDFSLKIIALLVLCLGGALANVSHADNLLDIYNKALKNDPQYAITTSQHQSAELNLALSKTAFKPSATFDLQWGKNRADLVGTSTTTDDHFASFNLAKVLYDKANSLVIEQSDRALSVSSLQLEAAKQDLIVKVAELYFNLLAAEDAKEVARLEKIAIKRQMDLAQERLDVGLGTRTDLFDSRARFKQAEANEFQAQNQINNELSSLEEMTGTIQRRVVSLKDSTPLALPVPQNLDHWINQAQKNDLAVKVAALNVKNTLQQIEIEGAARRSPIVNINGRHRFSDSGGGLSSATNEVHNTSIGVTVSFPIYLAGSVSIKTNQAHRAHEQARLLMVEAKRQAATKTTAAYFAVSNGVSQVLALKEAVVAGENALQAKEDGFATGLTTNIDVLDAQRDLSQSRTNYLGARYNYILATLQLQRAVGNLNKQDLTRVNNWLN